MGVLRRSLVKEAKYYNLTGMLHKLEMDVRLVDASNILTVEGSNVLALRDIDKCGAAYFHCEGQPLSLTLQVHSPGPGFLFGIATVSGKPLIGLDQKGSFFRME